MSEERPEAPGKDTSTGGLGDLEALLDLASSEEEDASGLEFLFAKAEADMLAAKDERPFDPDEFEAELRSSWSLPTLDVRKELSRQDALNKGGTFSEDPFAVEDFTEQQWAVVMSMKKPCLDAIDPKADTKARARAIRWIFEVGCKNRAGLDFETACRSLGTRPFVVQALIHHFWYLRMIEIEGGLPYLSRPLAETLESEAIMIGMESGLALAQVLWANPSMPEAELFVAAGLDPNETSVANSYARMIEEGFFGVRGGRVYFTSRHPERRHRANADQGRVRGVTWAGSFIGGDDED